MATSQCHTGVDWLKVFAASVFQLHFVQHRRLQKDGNYSLSVYLMLVLQVTPRVGALGPQSSMRVQVDFSPPAAALQQPVSAATAAVATAAAAAPVANAALTQGGAAGAAAQGVANQQTSQQASEQQQQQQPGHFQEWLLPCFIREAEATTTSSGGLVDSSSSGNAMCTTWAGSGMPQHQQQQQMMPAVITNSSSSGSSGNAADYVLHVSVATCAIAPELHLVSPQLPKPAGKNFVVLDFGALPVGERTTRELLLQNTGVGRGMPCVRKQACCLVLQAVSGSCSSIVSRSLAAPHTTIRRLHHCRPC